MKLFEVLEPPPHGLTRLRAKRAARRGRRWAWPALAVALAATVTVLFVVPREAPVDFGASLQGSLFAPGAGPAVSALDAQVLGVEALPSGNPRVLLYRVAVLSAASAPAPSP